MLNADRWFFRLFFFFFSKGRLCHAERRRAHRGKQQQFVSQASKRMRGSEIGTLPSDIGVQIHPEKKKKKKKISNNGSPSRRRNVQDQCCATGHTCCAMNGRGTGCAPPGGDCCYHDATSFGFACADGHTCCGNKCMPLGAVCCAVVPGSADSRYCPPGSKCSTETPTCSSASLVSISSAIVALLAVVSFS